jgi:hypothetical protein
VGRLFPRELYDGNQEGELLYCGPQRICYVRLWKWTSVSIGGPLLGNFDERSFSRAFERQEKFIYFGESFLWGILKTCKKGPCKPAAVFIGALLRKL